MIAAGLARGESLLRNCLLCEDTDYTAEGLRGIGVLITFQGEDITVRGTGGVFPELTKSKELYVGNSGTSFRLLLSVLALTRGEFLLTGTGRMQERPIGPLVSALNRLGVDAVCIGAQGLPPVRVRGSGMDGGWVRVSGDVSSQFVSSLLLSGPYARKDVEVEVDGHLVSKPYVDITLDVMERFGVRVERQGYRYFRIPSLQPYRGADFQVQGDASSASYFWAAAAVTGGTLTTENIYPFDTRQGDVEFLELLGKMGCQVEKERDRVSVRGGDLTGIEADMSGMPDLVPTLSAIALFADGDTVIRNVSHLRHKESDRLQSVAQEWSRMGAFVEELPDGLVIRGDASLSGAVVDPHDDHRIAMSLAVVGLKVPGVRIKDEACVGKSMPQFWDLWERLESMPQAGD